MGRTLLFTGKGGVGKSTMAAATAWQLSRRHRVLVASLDPAHNLGDIFGVRLNGRMHRYDERLRLLEVDVQERSRAYLRREIGTLSDTYRYLQPLNLEKYFSVLKYSPGIEEFTLLSGVEEILRDHADCDYIIFDTPPTGLTLRILALPVLTLTWLERLIQIRRQIVRKRHTIGKIVAPGGNGGDSEEVTLAHDPGADRVLGRLHAMHRQYEALNRRLRDEDCSIALVFNPDFLSWRESERLLAGLQELELPVRLAIDNKVDEAHREHAEEVERRFAERMPGTPLQRVRLAPGVDWSGFGRPYEIDEDMTQHFA